MGSHSRTGLDEHVGPDDHSYEFYAQLDPDVDDDDFRWDDVMAMFAHRSTYPTYGGNASVNVSWRAAPDSTCTPCMIYTSQKKVHTQHVHIITLTHSHE